MSTNRKIILGICIILLTGIPFVIRYIRGEPKEIAAQEQERPDYIPITDILPVHEKRIKERIELLQKQTLDETFAELLEDQQYTYPGFHSEAKFVPVDIETILSTRSFLKVFQQFGELPREQAVKKLNVFCKNALDDFSVFLGTFALNQENPNSLTATPKPMTLMGCRYMVCTSMLLAARMGEHKLLLHQIDEMQRIIDNCLDKSAKSGNVQPDVLQMLPSMFLLEDECILTVLMYALTQAGAADIPFENTLNKETIPLFRWDAALTYYDFEVRRELKTLNPNDAVEHFVVYVFSDDDRFDDKKKKLIINALKERLSK